jgi:hypothetical protein
MIIKITPSSDQIRFFAEEGRSAFDTLRQDDAVDVAIRAFDNILEYLELVNRTDHAEIILKSGRTELVVGGKSLLKC